tara:strand:- start:2142 stop:7037 length:4896 start_codon:yes stop_codon:yes gene_type:complete
MTTITQKIPNLLGGISQQPDAKKYPGEVRDMVNAFPEYALGLMKRPGAKLESSLRGAATPGGTEGTREWGATEKWFDINIDGVPYVGQINDYANTGVTGHHINLKLWYKESGLPRAVSYDDYYSNPAYISSGSWATYVANINSEASALSSKISGLTTFQNEQKTYYTNYQATNDQFNNIFDISTTYNLGEVYQFINNAILEDSNGNISYIRDGGTMSGSLPSIQATASITLSDNLITEINLTSAGAGYETPPAATISGSGSAATAEVVLNETGDLKSINVTNAGGNYFDIPIVSFTGGLKDYKATAVVNWFTQEVVKVLVEDGDFIDLADPNNRRETGCNIGQHPSGYGGHDGSFEGQRLFQKNGFDEYGNPTLVTNDVEFYNTGRDQMVFSDGSGLCTGIQGIYLHKKDLTGKSKIRIMAATGNKNWPSAEGASAHNGVSHSYGDGTKHYSVGTYNGGQYNDYKDGPYGNSRYPKLDVYIAKAGVTAFGHGGQESGWTGSTDPNGPPDSNYLSAHPDLYSGSGYRGDWQHIGQIFSNDPDKNSDEPYYLSEYEFDIPAELRGPDCYIAVGTSTQTPGILAADTSKKFTVTTLTLLNETPTTTDITDSEVVFTENTALSSRVPDQFPLYQQNYYPPGGPWTVLDFFPTTPSSFFGTLTTPNRITYFNEGITTAVADVIMGYSVNKINLTNPGSNYNNNLATTISIAAGNSTSQATATVTLKPTFAVETTNVGLGYVTATGTITGGGGTGATASIDISQGKIQNITVTGGDSNYISDPTLTISPPSLAGGTTFPISASTGEFTETSTNRVFRIGVDKTDAYPILMNRLDPDSKIWELIEVTKATDADGSALATYEAGTYATEQTTYEGLITARNNAITTTDGSYPTFDTSIAPANDYFADDLNGGTVDLTKLKIVTFQDTTFILNPTKKVSYTTYKTPVSTFEDGFLFFNVLTSGDYKVNLTKLQNDPSGLQPNELNYIRTVDSSFGTNGTIVATATYSTSTATVEAMRAALESSFQSAYGSFTSNFDFIKSGNGIYIKSKAGFAGVQFELEVESPQSGAFEAVRHEIGSASQLPTQIKDGYKVKIVNTTDVNADDMYLEFRTETDNEYSAGTWVEAPGFNIPTKIDKTTMPHALTINPNGSFSFAPWPHWEDRLVGDEVTNPTPHFISTTGGINRYIKDIFVYRNRLGFLTEDYVSLSKAGEFFNFFAKSAVASGNDDPIDISVSDNDSPSLNYVSKETAGLLLYGKTGQYLLATDSDILSPTTAKINKVAGYEADMDNPAISLGSTTAFISKTASTTKMFELLKVNALEPPQSIEQTRTVPELVPTDVDSIVGSPDVGLVSFGKVGTKDLYHFNYLRAADQEIGSAWYRWKLPGNLEHQFFDGNSYHTILRTDNNEHVVVSFDVAQSSTDGVLSLESGKKTDLHLDVFQNNPFTTYTEVAGGSYVNKTKVYLPTAKVTGLKLVVVMYSNRSQVFDEDNVTYTTGSDSYGDYVEVSGDWRGSDVFIGYKFDMSVELPRMYYKKSENQQVSSDIDADLILHRLRVKTGLTGPVDYKIKIIGIPVRTSTVSVTPPEQYLLNSTNMTESAVHDVPVYQRNNNTTITIQSNTAFPTTIESINWEGRYSTNYYRRS